MTDTLTAEEQADLDAFNEAWQQIRLHRPDRTVDSELKLAGGFVADFGTLGDWFEEPQLSMVQFMQARGSAVSFLGHWSVQRGDPTEEPKEDFFHHLNTPAGCKVCTYLEKALELHRSFADDDCEHCGLGIDAHEIVPDGASGEPFAACLSPWQRREPWTHTAADAGGPDQISPVAYDASWWAKLTDGTFALITRSYYVIDRDGRVFLEEQTEYMWCRDLTDPGTSEINAEYTYEEVDTGGEQVDEDTDVEAYARDAEAPGLEEWDENAPESARGMLAAPE